MKPQVAIVNQFCGFLCSETVNEGVRRGVEVRVLSGRRRYPPKGLMAKALAWAAFTVETFFRALFLKADIYIVTSNPPIAFWMMPLIRLLTKTPYILVVYDLYPHALISNGLITASSKLAKFWSALNSWSFRHAESVVVLDSAMKEHVVTLNCSAEKITVIPTWVNTDLIEPDILIPNGFRERFELGDRRIVMYAGNLGRAHSIEDFVQAIKLLAPMKDVTFAIVGNGPKRAAIETQLSNFRHPDVVLLPRQDEDFFPSMLSIADISVITIGKGFEGVVSPSKTYFAMAAGSALIGISPLGSQVDEVISDHNCGQNCEPGNPEAIAEAILDMLNHPERMEQYKTNARTAAVKFFDTEIVLDEFWKSTLLHIVGQSNRIAAIETTTNGQ